MDNQYNGGNDGSFGGDSGSYSGGGGYSSSGGYDGGNGGYSNSGGYNSGGYNGGNNYYPNYNAPQNPDELPMTFGEWLLTLILGAIPCVGFILLVVWALGSTGNVNRRNYARAVLVIGIIGGILWGLFYGMFSAAFVGMLKSGTLLIF